MALIKCEECEKDWS